MADHEYAGAHGETAPKSKKRRFLSPLVSVVGIAVFATWSTLTLEGTSAGNAALSLLLFGPLLAVLLGLIFAEIRSRPYSLNLMHLVAILLFMCLAPMLQVAHGYYPLEIKNSIIVSRVVLANVSTFLWILAYAACYHVASRRPFTQSSLLARIMRSKLSRLDAILMLSLTPIALGWLWAVGLAGAATREVAEASLSEIGGPTQLISSTFVRGLPFVALGTSIAVLRERRAWILLPLILVIAAASIYVNNPMAAPRYWTVAILIGIVAPLALARRRTGSLLLIAAVAGLVIMPALDLGRRLPTLGDVLFEFKYLDLPSPAQYLAQNGDLASFGIFTLGIEWTEQFGHTWGRQLLGATILFWIPRSIWPTKPISTGSQIVGDLGFDFTVLSAPIMADAFLDFGILGVIAFASVVGLALAKIDSAYYADSERSRVIDSFYPFLLGMMLFLTRGSLMSAFPYTLSFAACALPLVFPALLRLISRKSSLAQERSVS